MGRHSDGKGGEEGDQRQSKQESDGQWIGPIPDEEPDE